MMQTAFRWYGPQDRVPLSWLKQMTPTPLVVTHLGDIPPGDVWTMADLQALKAQLDTYGLSLGPIESVFWSDAMKQGTVARDEHIDNYCQTLRNLRTVFPEIKDNKDSAEIIVTYNLMLLDWSRTHLAMPHPNGARGLAFDQAAWESQDFSNGLFLPGWGKGYSKGEFEQMQATYNSLGKEGLWQNVKYVLDAIVPVAESQNIRLAAHPNDPPWRTLGLPALLCNTDDIRTLLSLYPSRANALCFCTGSYGSEPTNHILPMIEEFKDSLAWMHLRTVTTTGEKQFHEADHADPNANVDMLDVMRKLVKIGFEGIFRSDHGLDIFYETDLEMRGYPAIDRYVANKMLWAYARALTTL
jgi:mannonate dehydratase